MSRRSLRSRKNKVDETNEAEAQAFVQGFEEMLLTSPKEKFTSIVHERRFIMNEKLHFSGKHADVLIAKKLRTPFKGSTSTAADSIFDNPAFNTPSKSSSMASSSSSSDEETTELKTPVKTGVVSLPISENLEDTIINAPFTTPTRAASANVAVKSQAIISPKDINDQAYRELLIYKSLTQLKDNGLCLGYIQIYDWFKSLGNYFDLAKTPSPPSRSRRKPKQYQYMNYILEQADETLLAFLARSKYILSLTQYKNILFQIMFSLHVAQREYQFVHNDLHLKNILIKKQDDFDGTAFSLEDSYWLVKDGLVVKITDFGLSRIRLPSGHIVSSKNHMQGEYNRNKDVQQIANELSKVRIDWDNDEYSQRQQYLLRDLKIKMNKVETTPEDVIHHEFFSSLKFKPVYDEKGNIQQDGKISFYGDFHRIVATPTFKTVVGSKYNPEKDRLFEMILKQQPLDLESGDKENVNPQTSSNNNAVVGEKRPRTIIAEESPVAPKQALSQSTEQSETATRRPKRRRIALK